MKKSDNDNNSQITKRPKGFQKGVVNNPHGRPKLPDNIKALRRETGVEAQQNLLRVWRAKENELHLIKKEYNYSAGLKLMASVMLLGIKNSDHKIMDAFLDRIIGKPLSHVELTGEDGGPVELEANEQLKTHLLELLNKKDAA